MRWMILTVTVFVTMSLTGCTLLNFSGTKVIGDGERRDKVEFESDQALRTFTGAVSLRYQREKDLGPKSWSIPGVVTFTDTERTLDRNMHFNAQVETADLNRDGVISNAEATAYATESTSIQSSYR